MEQIEIKFGGKPVRVRVAPSENYPEIPHKVLALTDLVSGQHYLPGPEMLMIEEFYQGTLDYELYLKKKRLASAN